MKENPSVYDVLTQTDDARLALMILRDLPDVMPEVPAEEIYKYVLTIMKPYVVKKILADSFKEFERRGWVKSVNDGQDYEITAEGERIARRLQNEGV